MDSVVLHTIAIKANFLREPHSTRFRFMFQSSKDCLSGMIRRPKIECTEEMKEVCSETIEIKEEEVEMEVCDVKLEKKGQLCKTVEFDVPKTVCKERPKPYFAPNYD